MAAVAALLARFVAQPTWFQIPPDRLLHVRGRTRSRQQIINRGIRVVGTPRKLLLNRVIDRRLGIVRGNLDLDRIRTEHFVVQEEVIIRYGTQVLW